MGKLLGRLRVIFIALLIVAAAIVLWMAFFRHETNKIPSKGVFVMRTLSSYPGAPFLRQC